MSIAKPSGHVRDDPAAVAHRSEARRPRTSRPSMPSQRTRPWASCVANASRKGSAVQWLRRISECHNMSGERTMTCHRNLSALSMTLSFGCPVCHVWRYCTYQGFNHDPGRAGVDDPSRGYNRRFNQLREVTGGCSFVGVTGVTH